MASRRTYASAPYEQPWIVALSSIQRDSAGRSIPKGRGCPPSPKRHELHGANQHRRAVAAACPGAEEASAGFFRKLLHLPGRMITNQPVTTPRISPLENN